MGMLVSEVSRAHTSSGNRLPGWQRSSGQSLHTVGDMDDLDPTAVNSHRHEPCRRESREHAYS